MKSSIQTKDEWEQLAALSGLSDTTGALHEAQVLQLRYWPAVAAPHAESYYTNINQEKREIDIHLTVKRKKAPKDFKQRLQALDRSIKTMLGTGWLVRVYSNKQAVYRGKRVKVERTRVQYVPGSSGQ